MERIIPIADTGFIVALLNRKDSRHTEIVSIYLQYSTIIVPQTVLDLIRVAQILEQYHDSRIDFVDATVMAVAERYDTKIVLTIDYRDFIIFRPQHCLNFEIKP